MTWTLIVLLIGSPAFSAPITTFTIPGFKSQQACWNAEKEVKHFRHEGMEIDSMCVVVK